MHSSQHFLLKKMQKRMSVLRSEDGKQMTPGRPRKVKEIDNKPREGAVSVTGGTFVVALLNL